MLNLRGDFGHGRTPAVLVDMILWFCLLKIDQLKFSYLEGHPNSLPERSFLDIESIEKAKNRSLREAQRAQEQAQSRTSNSSSDREGNEEDLEPIREEVCYKESITEEKNQRTIEPQPIFSQSDFTSSSSQSRTVSKVFIRNIRLLPRYLRALNQNHKPS